MERKRKLPARTSARTGQSKKRTLTPAEPASPALSTPVVEESLPKSIAGGKPLPTVEHPQPEDLPISQYQSVAESGVMAESLERSRKKWINEGIFEKYWTKPSKKKAISLEEQANNPSKDSMTKLGACTITIEPHVFEVMMYAVKDPNPRQPAQQPMYRPIIQYGPPQPPQPLPPQTQSTHMQHGTPAVSQPISSTAPASTPQSSNSNAVPQQNPNNAVSAPVPQTTPKPTNNPAPAPAPPAKSSDPVIQMLAERAATDQDLKALMRIVADGKATTEELKKFQAHIDELTKMLHARQAATAPPSGPTQPSPAANSARPPPTTTANVRTPQASPVTNGRPEYSVQPQPQALRSKGPLPPSKPDITAVVFEFIGGSGDRYLFPKYSILEYLPGGQVIASFLIVRKGSSADSKKYDPLLDYYQPITIRLYTHQGRQLESLAKVVAPQEEVRKYMDDIMDNMTRAEYVLLAMRLPREVEQPVEEDDTSAKAQQSTNQVLWTASSNLPVIKQKPAKKSLSEGEQYQALISSIS